LPNRQGPRGQVSVRQTEDGQTEIYGKSDIDINLEHINGSGSVMLTKSDIWTIELDVPNAIFEHEMLAKQALPPNSLQATAVWKPATNDLQIEGSLGDVAWAVQGAFDMETADLKVSVPMVDLRAIVDLFGPLIPEGDHARITGQVGLSGTLVGPEWAWTAEPAVDNLRVTGALPPTFGGHNIQWKVRTEDGAITYRSTGPGTPGWVHHEAAGWMPAAAVAAEDIRFHSHPGFDLLAIQEALQAAPKDDRIRGGSTISQQLSKNLFLDGRRTFCRKLRELLLTMSLEHRMSKEAILTLYLNIVEFGPGIYGIGHAADAWFIKQPSGLTPREAAFLASILPAPRMWHERISKTGSVPIRRVNEVLSRMGRRGDLTAPQLQRAKRAKLRVVPP
ncbi:MAG: transglycosylase domain-containing protein, partial [Myxococcota bacterium]